MLSEIEPSEAPDIPDICPSSELKTLASNTLGRLRNAVGLVIHATTNKGLHNSRDLQNELGVDRNLSWQIFKMLGPVDTLSILPYVPAPVSMKKLLTIIKKRGVPVSRIVEAESAFAAFEDFVQASASDRDRLGTMLMSLTDSDEGRQIDLQHRKAAFRAHSHFYGIEVDTVVHTLIYSQGSSPDRINCIGLQQLSGMRRLRLDTEIVVSRMNMHEKGGGDRKVMPSGMIDEAAARIYGAAVIPEFCSNPMPGLSTVVDANGLSRTILTSRHMGSAADMDLAFGRACLDLPLITDADGRQNLSALIPATRPTQLFIGDMFVHRPSFPNVEQSCSVWGQCGGYDNAEAIEQHSIRLPMREEFVRIGSGEDMARIRELPRYTELVRKACERFGVPINELDLYRIRMIHPLVESRLILKMRIGH